MDANWAGYSNAHTDEVTAWQPSGDLMKVILADTAESGLGIRLDDDVYIEANKESALHVFGVVTL